MEPIVVSDVESPDAFFEIMEEEDRREKQLKAEWKKKLKGLINTTGLWRYLNKEEGDYWTPMDIVEVYLTDEKKSGYSKYLHARIKDDPDKLLYMQQPICYLGDFYPPRGIKHYYVWQTVGYLGDDYSGYLLFPLNDGRYFRISYSC